MWYGSATQKEREKPTGLFCRQPFDLDLDFFIPDSIQKLATNFITDFNGILYCCYVTEKYKFIIPKTGTSGNKRFATRSVQIVNNYYQKKLQGMYLITKKTRYTTICI